MSRSQRSSIGSKQQSPLTVAAAGQPFELPINSNAKASCRILSTGEVYLILQLLMLSRLQISELSTLLSLGHSSALLHSIMKNRKPHPTLKEIPHRPNEVSPCSVCAERTCKQICSSSLLQTREIWAATAQLTAATEMKNPAQRIQ